MKRNINYLVLALALSSQSYGAVIKDYFLDDPNVIRQTDQAFGTPDQKGKMNAYGHVFVRGDKIDEVVEKKSKKSNMSEQEKEALADQTYKILKMFFKPGDNKRTQSVTSDEFLWETLNGVGEGNKEGYWSFRNKNYVFAITKSAYRSTFEKTKDFKDLFGEVGGKSYVKKYVGENSQSTDQLLREELTVNFVRGAQDHFSWRVDKNVFAKKSNSSSSIEFKISNIVQVAKIENDENKEERIKKLNEEIKEWNKLDGHAKEKENPEDIQLAQRIKNIDLIDDSPNGEKPSYYIISYTRDFISKYKVLQKSVSLTKVYQLEDHFVSINYTIGVIGHRDCQEMQNEINGTSDPEKASGPNVNKVKEIVFTMIDKGFISSRNAAEEGSAK